MRAFRWCLLTTTTVALVAGAAGGAVVAQEEAAATPPVAVTATRDCKGVGDALVHVDEDGVEHLRFLVSLCELTSSDKGLDDPYILITHTDCYPDGGCTVWGTIETFRADGWRGAYRGWVGQEVGSHTVSALEGFGAFQGLTFVNYGLGDLPGTRSSGEVEGVIYAGDPPPWDDAPPR